VKTLTELREWNVRNQSAGAIKYGQAQLDISDEMDVDRDRARYEMDRAKDVRLTGAEGIDAVMRAERLDALLFPSITNAAISAKPGYPTVYVPLAFMAGQPMNPPLPQGVAPPPAPFGVSFAGGACSEPRLIALAYAFEQATKARVPPPGMP
jgi:amidase